MSKRKTKKKPLRSLDDMPTLKAKDKTQFVEFRALKRIRSRP